MWVATLMVVGLFAALGLHAASQPLPDFTVMERVSLAEAQKLAGPSLEVALAHYKSQQERHWRTAIMQPGYHGDNEN